jgi:hypothetical protein
MEGSVEEKHEGPAFRPLPVADLQVGRTREKKSQRDAGELPCEMCGAPIVAYHCKRICLRCGFMTGCSEGI